MTAQRICALADTLGLPLTLPEIDCILLEVSSGHYEDEVAVLLLILDTLKSDDTRHVERSTNPTHKET